MGEIFYESAFNYNLRVYEDNDTHTQHAYNLVNNNQNFQEVHATQSTYHIPNILYLT